MLAPGQSVTVTLAEKVGRAAQTLVSRNAERLYGLTVAVDREAAGRWTANMHALRLAAVDVSAAAASFSTGSRWRLRGDSWHFLGIPQMTRRYAWAWYTALKAAHGNAVRLHAQPYPRFLSGRRR